MDSINNNEELEAVTEAEISTNDDKVTVKIKNENVIISLNELNKMSKDKVLKAFNITKSELNNLLKEAGLYSSFQIRGKGKTLIWYKTKEEVEAIEAKKYTKKQVKNANKAEIIADEEEQINVKISNKLKKKLDYICNANNISFKDLINNVLEEYANKQKPSDLINKLKEKHDREIEQLKNIF